jgi:hypothetical protein
MEERLRTAAQAEYREKFAQFLGIKDRISG